VATRDVDISSTSRRADGDARGSVLSMVITYERYFKFLICYFIFFWKFTNLILQIQTIQENQ
jgi:hypothetical protein